MHHMPCLTLGLLAAFIGSGAFYGCAVVDFQPPADPRPIGPAVEVMADWDDLEAAVEVAMGANQLALLHRHDLGPMHREYHMVNVLDAPVVVTARALDAESTEGGGDAVHGQSIVIELTCRYGWSGDPGRESTIIRAVVRRLRQLHGRDYAPLHAPLR